jgi:DNA-binding NtrC family response regulator
MTLIATPVRPTRMLMVENAEDEAFLLYSELASRGLKIEYSRVDSAAQMSTTLAGGEWDIVVSDHDMPGFDAVAALRVLKDSGKDIPFVIYSGRISDRQAISAMQDGVHDYIAKGNYARLLDRKSVV